MASVTQDQVSELPYGAEFDAICIEVGALGRRTLDRLHYAYTVAFDELAKKSTEPIPEKVWKEHFNHITARARHLAVRVSEGGGAATGLSKPSFNIYVSTIRKTFDFDVPLDMAENLDLDTLRQMRDYRKKVFETSKGVTKVTAEGALVWLKGEQEKQRQKDEGDRKKREAEEEAKRQEALAQAAVNKAAGITGEIEAPVILDSTPEADGAKPESKSKPKTSSKADAKVRRPLPVISEYDTSDEGSLELLKAISLFMREFFLDEALKPHLAKSFQLGVVFKEFVEKLVALDQRHGKKGTDAKTESA